MGLRVGLKLSVVYMLPTSTWCGRWYCLAPVKIWYGLSFDMNCG